MHGIIGVPARPLPVEDDGVILAVAKDQSLCRRLDIFDGLHFHVGGTSPVRIVGISAGEIHTVGRGVLSDENSFRDLNRGCRTEEHIDVSGVIAVIENPLPEIHSGCRVANCRGQ
ncbi:hypothetical protein SDC9_209345 [bioreactor metagenome]|uniref:Uncharacterized protein n=1 Tax=bioreactor metagenome TaxID=1076179 RepID=A0A645JE48_9ZZZZ